MGRIFAALGYAIGMIVVGVVVLRRLLSGGPLFVKDEPDEPDGPDGPDQPDDGQDRRRT